MVQKSLSPFNLPAAFHKGSILGPVLAILYMADLISLIKQFGLSPHLYADNTQIYGACSQSGVNSVSLLSELSSCMCAVTEWIRSNRLQAQLWQDRLHVAHHWLQSALTFLRRSNHQLDHACAVIQCQSVISAVLLTRIWQCERMWSEQYHDASQVHHSMSTSEHPTSVPMSVLQSLIDHRTRSQPTGLL